ERAQQPDSNLEAGGAEMALRELAIALAPGLWVDWEAEPLGAPPWPSEVKRKQRRRKRPKTTACVDCGRPGVYRTKPNRKWNPWGSWYCRMHEADARQREAEDELTDRLMPSLRAANPPQAIQAPITQPQAVSGPNDKETGTDVAALLREVLEGLQSYLANSEWRFPAVTLTPTLALGSGKNARPECSSMGKLRDVVITGIRDLLMEYGHKVRR